MSARGMSARRMSARTRSAERMSAERCRPARMMNQSKSKVQIQGFCFFFQPPRGGYFSPRDDNHDKGVIFPPETRTTTRGIFFPQRREPGVLGFSPTAKRGILPPRRREPRQGGYFSHPHNEGVIFPPIDEGFLSSVVVGSGRHPAEMKLHCSITPTTAWKGDFALVETNLKLFTSTRRPSQRKSACGSPQHIPNCRQKSTLPFANQ